MGLPIAMPVAELQASLENKCRMHKTSSLP